MFRPSITLSVNFLNRLLAFYYKYEYFIIVVILMVISITNFILYWHNGLGLSYNDARSHLDIGRRVVEGLKPGIAQLGSVWLPLPHALMILTIWNDFMWHTGLAGAIWSMISFIATGVLIYTYLKKLGANLFSRLFGLLVFVGNINILYLQSTAMTELLLIASMTAAVYELILWHKDGKIINLIVSSGLIMVATLIRYDAWFLLIVSAFLVGLQVFKKNGYKAIEGVLLFFLTLAGLGIILWLLWNLLIFKDPLYFAFGPYSAHAQQEQLNEAGVLATKGNMLLSAKIYLYALAYNSGALTLFLSFIGAITFYMDKRVLRDVRIASLALLAPLVFNILALYLGHSVLFIQGISGNTWFNVRYGIMMMPSIAIYLGYLIHKSKTYNYLFAGMLTVVIIFSFIGRDAVTIDDARVGSSQKNVSEVSSWLNQNAKDKDGFVLISAASHDAIIFSSGLPMKKFIHEGTGAYWISATSAPDRWARWIVMRTNDDNDQTFRLIKNKPGYKYYTKVKSFPFADIYELKPEYLKDLHTKEVYFNQK